MFHGGHELETVGAVDPLEGRTEYNVLGHREYAVKGCETLFLPTGWLAVGDPSPLSRMCCIVKGFKATRLKSLNPDPDKTNFSL